jgi:predicted RNA-binding Zn ribbon-like protein
LKKGYGEGLMEIPELVALGDHPALNFLNSTAVPAPGTTLELIGDGRSYLEWLRLAGLIDAADAEAATHAFGLDELDAVAAEAVQLREWLRPVVAARVATGRPALPAPDRDRLNQVLALGRRFEQVEVGGDGWPQLREHRIWDDHRQLLVPPAEAAAQLLTDTDWSQVRHCEGATCTLWFYDRTKSHRRRWCSMAACGNREKARKHRQRSEPGERLAFAPKGL